MTTPQSPIGHYKDEDYGIELLVRFIVWIVPLYYRFYLFCKRHDF